MADADKTKHVVQFGSSQLDAAAGRLWNGSDPIALRPKTWSEQQRNHDELEAQLTALRASAPSCPGDGNIDFVVDDKDLANWSAYNESYGQSSVYDITLDGYTNATNQAMIQQCLGTNCRTE